MESKLEKVGNEFKSGLLEKKKKGRCKRKKVLLALNYL